MSEGKDNAVTISKGIAIILMVVGHSSCPDLLEKYIVLFHMPLFFFFSGYCFKTVYLQDSSRFIKKRIVKLWWPFVKWGLFFLILHNVFYELNIYNGLYGYRGNVSHLYSFPEFMKRGLLVIFSMRAYEQLLGGYWFLHDLFFASIVSLCLLRMGLKYQIIIPISLILSLILSLGQWEIHVFEVGYRQLLAVSFYLTGCYFRDKEVLRKLVCQRWTLLVASLTFLLCGPLVFHASMIVITPAQIIPYFLIAIIGLFIVYRLSSYMLNYSKIANLGCFVGNNTMTILTWHFLAMRMVSLVIIILFNLPIENLACHPVIDEYSGKGWWIIYTIAGIILPCGLVFLNRFKIFSWIKF
jgi:fucose 4-O-acetylase-like acetyltransferase